MSSKGLYILLQRSQCEITSNTNGHSSREQRSFYLHPRSKVNMKCKFCINDSVVHLFYQIRSDQESLSLLQKHKHVQVQSPVICRINSMDSLY